MNTNVTKKHIIIKSKASASLYNNGIKFKRHLLFCRQEVTSKRGEIKEFSYAARRRLREYVLTHKVNDSVTFGLTLTLPSQYDETADFSELIRRFGIDFCREFKNSAVIWRAELQKRGAPHLHLILYMSKADIKSDLESLVSLKNIRWSNSVASKTKQKYFLLSETLIFLWAKNVANIFTADIDYQNWMRLLSQGKGFCIQELSNESAMLRYIVDDTSKHKKEQLGYKGKQWGKFNSKKFIKVEPVKIYSEDESLQRVLLGRIIGKMRRYMKKSDCVFGSKHSRYIPLHQAGGITYYSTAITSRLMEYINQESQRRFIANLNRGGSGDNSPRQSALGVLRGLPTS